MTETDELLLLRALLRASDYGVLLSDSARRDRVCNQRFCEMFGLDSPKAIQSQADYMQATVLPRLRDPERFLQTLQAVYSDPRRTLEDEIEIVQPRPCLLRRYSAPVFDENNALIGRVWTFLDITRARGMENKVRAQAAQLKAQARELAGALRTVTGRLDRVENTLSLTQQQLFESEKLSAVGLLAASVAHDIRNILTPLAIELSLADQNDPAGRAESLEAMRRQVDSLALLTHRLLALARPASTERAPTDLAGLLDRIVTLIRSQAAQENVRIVTKAARALPPVLADHVQIDQVLVNLVLNAMQAMRATGGGTLTLTLGRHRGGVRIRVADTGFGIPPKLRSRLFDPFFTTRPDGAGLGLFSCRRIVQAHGGTIGVRSVPEQGSQFTLWLPLEGDTVHGWEILVVEDDRAIAQSLTRLLARESFFVTALPSAEEAIAHLQTDTAYDLALLDVALPGMDGFACCRALRDQGWRQPILLLTGRSGRMDKIAGLHGGADDYMTKPFDPGELMARIHAHLRRSQEYDVPREELHQIEIGPELRVDLRNREVLVRDLPVHLTEREYELLLLLARHQGTALDKMWLYQQIWGNSPEEGIKALAVYVRRLRQKIEADENHPQYIQTVRGFGYKLVQKSENLTPP